MSNDAERLQCLLLNFTDTMQNLFKNDIEKYLNIMKKIEDWNKFKYKILIIKRNIFCFVSI